MKFSIYLAAVVVVLGVLFMLLRPGNEPSVVQTKDTASTSVPAPPDAATAVPAVVPAAPPAPQAFELTVRGGRLVSGPSIIQVRKNDDVVINLISDAADELHLHGYDLHLKTHPGETATLRFTATKTGRFGYELHHAKAELGALEVYPR